MYVALSSPYRRRYFSPISLYLVGPPRPNSCTWLIADEASSMMSIAAVRKFQSDSSLSLRSFFMDPLLLRTFELLMERADHVNKRFLGMLTAQVEYGSCSRHRAAPP